MPELPEVETTCRGIESSIVGQKISKIEVRQQQLRWLIPLGELKTVEKQQILAVKRRSKYIIIECSNNYWLLIHLGMSGSLRLPEENQTPGKHDHFDIVMQDKTLLRYRDPRKFGCLLAGHGDYMQHRLLAKLGPEPLTREFNTKYLQKACSNKRIAIKLAIMQAQVVVGVGNIYASEALFHAKIHPLRPAQSLSADENKELVKAIKKILKSAIKSGGTTLRDFAHGNDTPGYFQQQLSVYGQDGNKCQSCNSIIEKITQGGRSSFYCPKCQTNKTAR
jgi:formamidopyrimidine-DNA glycosylase